MRRTLIISGLVILGVAAWFWGLPSYRAYKERKFSALARTHLAKGEHRAALLSAQQALALNGTNLSACEVMAELADLSRSPNAIMWRRRVAEIAPNLSNQVILAACALRYEQPPFAFAQQSLDGAAKFGDVNSSVPFHVVAAQLALKQGRIADAQKFFENAIKLEPTNQLHRLNLATVRAESPDKSVAAAAQAELAAMQNDPQAGEYAMRALAAHHSAHDQLDKALEFSRRLVGRKDVKLEDRIEHMTLLHQAKLPEFATYAQDVERAASTNAAMTFTVANRLMAIGETEKALAWLKTLPATMQSEQPVPLAFADAMARLKDWRGMEQRLNGERWKDQDFVRLALLAYAVRSQNNDQVVAQARWKEAVQLASDRPERTAVLVQMAGGWGWNAEAEDLLWRVAKNSPRERWAIDSLHNGYARSTNTHGLFSIYALMLEREQTNRVVMNNYASLALLLKTNLSRAHQLAHDVYLSGTNNYAFVSTYAWSLHLQGKNAEALALMETIAPARLADPSVAGYYGAILAANGQKQKAQQFLDKTKDARLLPEERALADEARAKL